MSQFERYLLKLSYDNYIKTNNLKFKFLPKNSEKLIHTINALKSLKDNEYIKVLSENLDNNTFNIVSYNDIVFIFSLTDKALLFIRNGWKD